MAVKRWTIGGGYDGALHAVFVFDGPHIPPMERVEVVPAAAYYEAAARIREAPHAWDCATMSPMQPGPCTCWKRDWPEDAWPEDAA